MFNAFSASDPRWIVLVAFSAGVCPCPAVVAKISENKTAAGKPQRAEDFKDMATGLRRGEGKAVFFFRWLPRIALLRAGVKRLLGQPHPLRGPGDQPGRVGTGQRLDHVQPQ